MAIGAIPQNDYVILVTHYNGTTQVFGTFDNYTLAFGYRRDRIPAGVKKAEIKPVNGIG